MFVYILYSCKLMTTNTKLYKVSLYLDIVNITHIDIHVNYVHHGSIKYTYRLITRNKTLIFFRLKEICPRASNLT